MNEEVRKILLLMSACTNGKDSELKGIIKSEIESSELLSVRRSMDTYYFLTPQAIELKQKIADFTADAADFHQALERWHVADDFWQQFQQLHARNFVPGERYHIIHKNDFDGLLRQARAYLNEKLYDIVRLADIRNLRKLDLPLWEDINEVVEFTNHILASCPCCYSQADRNITNLTRENALAILHFDTITQLRIGVIPPQFAVRPIPEENLDALFSGSLYCISSKNYHAVLEEYIRMKSQQSARGNAELRLDPVLIGVIMIIVLGIDMLLFHIYMPGVSLEFKLGFMVFAGIIGWLAYINRNNWWWYWRDWW